ncbi:LysR family transcriptional regulator [Gymnodinialimonas ulvae]|uniref:LysR family transcriptional regulator n=1 Tax=Gymnodinialimonas ulvae TaxID=3126504 RepID=UPI0030967D83
MIDKLRMMAIFQAVAEAGSFRAAAKRLNLSPSVISHHISQFEAQLGVPLLYRSTRRMSLTDAGRDLLGASQRMSTAAVEGLAALERRKRNPSGRLRLTSNTAAAHHPYSEIWTRFARAYPDIQLEMHFSDARVPLEGSGFDVAIRGTSSGLDDSSYHARKLGQLRLCMFCSPDYARARPAPRDIDDLADWGRIEYLPVPWQVLATSEAGDVPKTTPRVVQSFDNFTMARAFVEAGLGFMVETLPLVMEDLRTGRLVQILPERPLKHIEAFAVYPANAGRDSLARLLVDFLLDQRWLSDHGWESP